MKHVVIIHSGEGDEVRRITLHDQIVAVRRVGSGSDLTRARDLIVAADGQVDAIALEGLPMRLQLRFGESARSYQLGAQLAAVAQRTPVVDGTGVRTLLERWAVSLTDHDQPGLFAQKRVLMVPGLHHDGLRNGLERRAALVRYADLPIYLGLPVLPGVASRQALALASAPLLDRLKLRGLKHLHGSPPVDRRRTAALFHWADILAGDLELIRAWAPAKLRRKTVVVESLLQEDLDDLRERGVSHVVALYDTLIAEPCPWRWSAAAVEALLAALRPRPEVPLSEDSYLDLLAHLHWTPRIHTLQPDELGLNSFAFVIHPLNTRFIHRHKWFGWTRYLPDSLVEPVAARFPPLYLGRIKGGVSPTTGQRIEGHLITLGATPRQMMRHRPSFTYQRLLMAARMAERHNARIMGLGAFTSVVGDAGVTVAQEAAIAITSGNSLTVAATLEAAKQALIGMGASDLTHGRAMVIGATGSIGSVCARMLAQATGDIVLVAIDPEKLLMLKRQIEQETPTAHITVATHTTELVGSCDLIVTATSAFGQRIIDISQCKPGAVICDVARPPDISRAEAALRPDLLVIESGEVLIPGVSDLGYDIGLPPGTAYACLAETALLAMDGRFEDYTLGRNISMERVKEIDHLFKKHGFQLAGLRSFGAYISDEDLARRRALAAELSANPELFVRTRAEASAQLARLPRTAKGVHESLLTILMRNVHRQFDRAMVALVNRIRRTPPLQAVHEELHQ